MVGPMDKFSFTNISGFAFNVVSAFMVGHQNIGPWIFVGPTTLSEIAIVLVFAMLFEIATWFLSCCL